MVRAVAACAEGRAAQDDQDVDHCAGHGVTNVVLAALRDGLVVDRLQYALDQDERTAEDCTVRLEHRQGRLDDAGRVLSFRLVVRLKDVQVILIKEGVTSADSE